MLCAPHSSSISLMCAGCTPSDMCAGCAPLVMSTECRHPNVCACPCRMDDYLDHYSSKHVLNLREYLAKKVSIPLPYTSCVTYMPGRLIAAQDWVAMQTFLLLKIEIMQRNHMHCCNWQTSQHFLLGPKTSTLALESDCNWPTQVCTENLGND